MTPANTALQIDIEEPSPLDIIIAEQLETFVTGQEFCDFFTDVKILVDTDRKPKTYKWEL